MFRPAHAVVFAGVMLKPLGALSADFVVWWEQGVYAGENKAVDGDGRRLRAEDRQRSRDRLPDHPKTVLEEIQAALEAGQPPDFLFGLVADNGLDQWAYEGRLVDLTDALGPLASLFDADALEGVHTAQRPHGKAGAILAADGPRDRPYPRLDEPVAACRLHGSPTSRRNGRRLWSFWCDRVQPAVRNAMGRDDIWGVGLAMSIDAGDTHVEYTQFQHAYDAYWVTPDGQIQVDDPGVRANLIKAMEAYTAIYLTGCAPPDAIDWDNRSNNDRFVAQTVVIPLNSSLSIPNAIEASRPDDYRGIPQPSNGRMVPTTNRCQSLATSTAERCSRLKSRVRWARISSVSWSRMAGSRTIWTSREIVCCRQWRSSSKLPFWLDRSDRHRMASAIQTLAGRSITTWGVQPIRYSPIELGGEPFHRVVAEGWMAQQAVDEAIARIKQILNE